MAANVLSYNFVAFADQVSIDYAKVGACGNATYSVLDFMLNAAPSIIKAEHTSGDPNFKIIIDTKDFANAGSFKLLLRG